LHCVFHAALFSEAAIEELLALRRLEIGAITANIPAGIHNTTP
jgi:hypothetical protein